MWHSTMFQLTTDSIFQSSTKPNTLHPRLSELWLSEPWLFECKISQATPIFTKATWVVAIAKFAKWRFPIVKAVWSAENVLVIEEKLGIGKLMATDRSYTKRYEGRQSTTVTKTWKENVWHGHGKRHLKIGVQPKLDEHCIFGLGRQQSEKAMLVMRLMLLSRLWRHCLKLASS